MKTVVDYLMENEIYDEDIAAHRIELRLTGDYILMLVDNDEYLIEAFGGVCPETEIRTILEDDYGVNVRFCDECGKPYDMGFMADGGSWYCC